MKICTFKMIRQSYVFGLHKNGCCSEFVDTLNQKYLFYNKQYLPHNSFMIKILKSFFLNTISIYQKSAQIFCFILLISLSMILQLFQYFLFYIFERTCVIKHIEMVIATQYKIQNIFFSYKNMVFELAL